jgi:hypothetical protein
METKFMAQLKAARRVSQPTVAVTTADAYATIATVRKEYKESAHFNWDCMTGLTGLNDAAREIISMNNISGSEFTNFAAMVDLLVRRTEQHTDAGARLVPIFPARSIVFAHNAHLFMNEPGSIQAVANLRDEFKQDFRTLIMLGIDATLPKELVQDTLILDEALPTDLELAEIVRECFKNAGLPKPQETIVDKAVAAIAGLAAYPAETAVAMSLTKSGLNIESLWDRKKKQVNGNKGISVYGGKERFDNILGLANAKGFCQRLINGKRKIRLVCFIDEIEKHINANSINAGTGDTTGEMLAPLLSTMEDRRWRGMIFVGVPAGGKSLLAKAIGNEADCMTLIFDFAGMKGSHVGDSGGQMRQNLKVAEAIGADEVLMIATSNNIEVIPPELRRRFTLGTFFFDLMSAEERTAAWEYYRSKNNINSKDKRPDDASWTAGEIRNCCENADNLSISLVEAAKFIVPTAKSGADLIKRLRTAASGKYIDASREGTYKYEEAAAAPSASRSIEL